ncbi:MAG: hypothetical protein PUP92_17400, partial [Rhizonema sp. PD38]|nr:hypothetical protein [Rhizonema sp. PD38]
HFGLHGSGSLRLLLSRTTNIENSKIFLNISISKFGNKTEIILMTEYSFWSDNTKYRIFF